MLPGWLLSPVTHCALAAAALGAALHLVCTLKIRRRTRPPQAQAIPAPAQPFAQARLADIEKRLEDLDARQCAREAAPAPPPLGAGFNWNRRSYALRLHRRGETAEQIASSLGLAAGEVRLLIKVHRILLERAKAPP